MKTIKGWIPAGLLALTMIFGTTVAQADPGIIFGIAQPSSDSTSCSDPSLTDGIIFGVANTGIIFGFADSTGIIFGSTDQCTTTNAMAPGIMVSD